MSLLLPLLLLLQTVNLCEACRFRRCKQCCNFNTTRLTKFTLFFYKSTFIFEYGNLYESFLQSAFHSLSVNLPKLNVNLSSKQLNHCSGSPTLIKNADDRIFFEEWLTNILSSSKAIQVEEKDCIILSPHLVVISGGKRGVVWNFKGLNRLSMKDPFNGPSISTIVPTCSKFMYHCKVDLKLGFNVDESTKPLLRL